MPEVPPDAVATFERNVRSYVAVAAASGAQVVLVTQSIHVRRRSVDAGLSYLAQWIEGLEPTEASKQLERFNSVLRSLSREGPALLIDVAEEVPWEDTDFTDPMHFSDRGSERMATFMADSLERSVLSGAGRESGPG
jgi:lysophospholipase L1-like esterase